MNFISVKASSCKSSACVASLENGEGGAHLHRHSARAILASLRDAREMDSDEHTEAYDALICEIERAMGLPHAQTLAMVEASVEIRL